MVFRISLLLGLFAFPLHAEGSPGREADPEKLRQDTIPCEDPLERMEQEWELFKKEFESIDWEEFKLEMKAAQKRALDDLNWEEFRNDLDSAYQEIDWQQIRQDMVEIRMQLDSLIRELHTH